jgi:hypothetical protein
MLAIDPTCDAALKHWCKARGPGPKAIGLLLTDEGPLHLRSGPASSGIGRIRLLDHFSWLQLGVTSLTVTGAGAAGLSLSTRTGHLPAR